MEGYTTEVAESSKLSSEDRDVDDDVPPTSPDSALVRNRRDVIGHEVRHSSIPQQEEERWPSLPMPSSFCVGSTLFHN
jgi:hypothetical protein